jgi:SAM-dependent methyltransferase
MLMSEPVPCNYCGVDDATVVFRAGEAQISQVVRCNRCGLMYASPRGKEPDHIQVAKYDPQFTRFQNGKAISRLMKEKIQVRDYDRTREHLNRLYPRRGKLVEVGSGLGYLLDRFRQDGWDVLGVEPDPQACRYAREEVKIEAINDILENSDLAPESIDVILLNHVIEHLDNPLETLRAVNRLLKTGGHFVIETPRYDTLMFHLLGRRERSVACNGHIYFFTTDSLRKLYEAAGFETVQLDYVGRSLTGERILYNVGVISKSPRIKASLERLSYRLGLERLKFRFNLRDMQRVCVRKVAPVPASSPVPARSAGVEGDVVQAVP